MLIAPPRGQDVEWGYAFDVHLNAFFPLLMILHLFQLPFLNGECVTYCFGDWLLFAQRRKLLTKQPVYESCSCKPK